MLLVLRVLYLKENSGEHQQRRKKYLRCYLDTVLLLKSKKPTIRNKSAYPKEVQAIWVSCGFNFGDTIYAWKL